MKHKFQKRISYQGDLKPFLQKVSRDFDIGEYQSYEIVPIGYEDFNLFLITNKGTFFVKVFGTFRDENECLRYVDVIEHAVNAGVSTPKLYKSNQGYLYQVEFEGIYRLIVMEYVDGKIFYELQTTPTEEEIKFIVKQTALINKIDLNPSLVYDHWAITSLSKEYEEKGKYLSEQDKQFIRPLVDTFKSLNVDSLPHCFVHGDITKTNTIKSSKGDLYILDFAVANWYPRIQELSVLLCDLFFDPTKTQDFPQTYKLVLSEYQKFIPLTSEEIRLLPTYLKLAHVMHVLLANYEKEISGNTSVENEYFLNIGRQGLKFLSKIDFS
jgi:Ser/Thr protein kinase RdoA (MazF antagonist)